MAVVTDDQIGDDVAATVAAVSGVVSCAYPPPEQAPIQGPSCWVDIGPTDVDMGNLEVAVRTITIVVATPRKGSYPQEYRLVLATARKIVIAFRTNLAIAGEAILMAPAQMSKPSRGTYGEVDPNITFCTVSLLVQTLEETVNSVAL